MAALSTETTVIGGGIVGLSVALGLLEAGHNVRVLDGTDSDHRASQGNFGLVWLQGKGAGYAPYAKWTRDAISGWPDFAAKITGLTGIDPMLEQPGGYEFFTDAKEFSAFCRDLHDQKQTLGDGFKYQVLTGSELRKAIPGIGPGVVGATFCPHDGHVNPLRLLRALRLAVQTLGGEIIPETPVRSIKPETGGGFTLISGSGQRFTCARVILCAGLGAITLGPQLGFKTPIRPQRGELLITEKLGTRLPFLSSTIRQVNEGGIQIGGTKAEVGMDDGDSLEMTARLARHAVTVFPALARVRLLRSWGALRIMSQDGYPIYAKSARHPGAFLVTCHSGVTLAPNHASALISWIDGKTSAADPEAFDENRVTLSPAA